MELDLGAGGLELMPPSKSEERKDHSRMALALFASMQSNMLRSV